jgi:hypothetical protein
VADQAAAPGRPPECVVRFTEADAQRAHDEWGANCGPGAAAAILGMTLDEIRPHIRDFHRKRYMNPSLMFDTLSSAGATWSYRYDSTIPSPLPRFGLARIQWEGPWTKPGVPLRARYRHTHWIGVRRGAVDAVFDINAMNVGGWISLEDWCGHLVPWLLAECEPKADGWWHITHSIEVTRRQPLAMGIEGDGAYG